jgi:hypothetical protein
MNDATTRLFAAAYEGDLEAVREAVSAGAELTETDDQGNTPLVAAIAADAAQHRKDIVKILLSGGADPDYHDGDARGVLYQAVFLQDAELMEMLLSAGANPNLLLQTQESLYSWAESDYVYDRFEPRLPFAPTAADRESPETWLSFLDRCAKERHVIAPDFLRVLRKYGAKTTQELLTDDKGAGKEPIQEAVLHPERRDTPLTEKDAAFAFARAWNRLDCTELVDLLDGTASYSSQMELDELDSRQKIADYLCERMRSEKRTGSQIFAEIGKTRSGLIERDCVFLAQGTKDAIEAVVLFEIGDGSIKRCSLLMPELFVLQRTGTYPL